MRNYYIKAVEEDRVVGQYPSARSFFWQIILMGLWIWFFVWVYKDGSSSIDNQAKTGFIIFGLLFFIIALYRALEIFTGLPCIWLYKSKVEIQGFFRTLVFDYKDIEGFCFSQNANQYWSVGSSTNIRFKEGSVEGKIKYPIKPVIGRDRHLCFKRSGYTAEEFTSLLNKTLQEYNKEEFLRKKKLKNLP